MNEQKLVEYLKLKLPQARQLRVSDFKRISGGASRETYAFELGWVENGAERRRPMILRRDPTGGLLQTSRDREYEALRAMHRAGLMVPEPILLELDPAVLERPFFIMERLPGKVSPGPFAAEEPIALRDRIAGQFLTELARLQALDYRELGLHWLGEPDGPEGPAREQTAHWRAIYERDRMGEHYPLLQAAFAWLQANPISCERPCVVHGDYRSGNYLYNESGMLAMLDWELVHLGDPMEDLGWASMVFWGRDGLAGGLMEREAFYRLYERKTNYRVDRRRLFFYQVLGNAKMAVICLSGIRAYAEGKTPDAVMPFLQYLLSPLFDDLAVQLNLT